MMFGVLEKRRETCQTMRQVEKTQRGAARSEHTTTESNRERRARDSGEGARHPRKAKDRQGRGKALAQMGEKSGM
jgi:hypothetical protein